MINMDKLLSLIAPSTCISCSVDGLPLCKRCYLAFNTKASEPRRCIFCNKHNQDGICRMCNNQTGINQVVMLGEHEGHIKKLIWDLKFNSSRANIICLADYLRLELAKFDNSRVVLIPAPTSPKRARARGYDQAKLLAKSISVANNNWFYEDILIRTKDYDQIGLNKVDRKNKTKDLFVLDPTKRLNAEQAIAIIVDDVVTTGSTIRAASTAISNLGFDSIVAAFLSHKSLET